MKWTPSPPSLIRSFENATQGLRGVERRKMFGYPAIFARGKMLAGLMRNSMVMKLGDADLKHMLALPGAKTFAPMKGRVMKQWAVVPPAMLKDAAALKRWLAKALAYGRSQPAKSVKPRKARRAGRRGD